MKFIVRGKEFTMETIAEGLGTAWQWLMDNILFINLILSIIIVFFQRRAPKTVWAWLLALYFIPGFGILFYLLFGQDFRKSKMFRIKKLEDQMGSSIRSQEEILRNFNHENMDDPLVRDYGDLIMYNLKTSGSVLTVHNDVKVFSDGEAKFEDLRKSLRQAQKFIHIQYYIIKNDELFDSIVPILIDRVRNGVEVRILYDGMGGRFMPKKRWEELKQAGVKVGVFFPALLGRLNLRVNYRNHRKIVVIDGTVGYVGGFNIGREYISRDPKFGYWRDTHLKITGDAVISLQIRFALDWNYAAHENLFQTPSYFDSPYRNGLVKAMQEEGKRLVAIQIIASGPDTADRQIRNNYLELFHKARKSIYIHTPYFVPDDAVLSALRIAARSGVDVRLMIPCKPDHPFVYWATYSYAGDLIEAGAKCYVYDNGFLHAKGVMVDGRVSSYGTANMDIRSFELNFEVNATIYDETITQQLEQEFMNDLKHCREITKEVYESRSLLIRIKEQGSRLLSPLL